MPYLRIETDEPNKEPRTVTLGNESVIGREKSNSVYIDDPRASRQHAKITKEPDGSFTLVDMGSRNGIIVNGEKVSRRKLAEKDRIVIGRTTLVYSESASSSVQPSAQAQPVAPVETIKMSTDDKTITADPLGRTAGEPAKLGSDALKKAIQDVSSARLEDKTAGDAKKPAPAGAGNAKSAPAPKTSSSDEVIEEEPSLGKRILVFLTFLIFFVVVLLFAKEMTKRLLFKAEKAQPAPIISSPEKPQDK